MGNKLPAWTPFRRGKAIDLTGDAAIDTRETWVNSRYQVFIYRTRTDDDFPVVHLSIKRNDRRHIHDWRELQRIKNELCGTTCEAVELYPAESRKADTANQFHLWCAPPGVRFPVGFNDGRLVDYDPATKEMLDDQIKGLGLKNKSKQRRWEKHHKSDDCKGVGPIWEE